MAGTLTTANTVFMMAITDIFPVPQQMQGFAADDITDIDPIEPSEVVMGVDGILSGGFRYVPIKQGISLQADSASNNFFDLWYALQQQTQDLFFATGIIVFPGLGSKYILNKGALTTYKPMPDAKRILQPRKYGVTWQSILPAVV